MTFVFLVALACLQAERLILSLQRVVVWLCARVPVCLYVDT